MKAVFDPKMKVVLVIFLLMASAMLVQTFSSTGTRAPAIPDDYHPGIIQITAAYPNSTPAVGYDVSVFQYGKTTSVSTNSTDSSGFAELTVNFGDLGHLTVYLGRYSAYADKEHITLGPDDIVSLEMTANDPLATDSIITGTVRDGLTNAPMRNINLSIEGKDHYGNEFQGYYLTSNNGKFDFHVPVSDQPYKISFLGGSLYQSYHSDVFPGTSPGTVEHDIYLYPTYQPDNPFEIRFFNTDLTEPYSDGFLEIYGSTTAIDHGYYTFNFNTNNSMDGWYESYLNHGEYSFSWSKELEEYDINLHCWSYFYVNYTEISMEIPIETPGWKLIEIEVWNETSPLHDTYLTYSTRLASETGWLTANSMNSTGTDGKTSLYIPDDRVTMIDLHGFYGGYASLEVDPSTGPEPIVVNVTLESERPPPMIEGDVKITVRDRLTNAKVPYARIYMYYSGPPYAQLYYKYTNIDGEYIGKARVGHYEPVQAFCEFGEGYLDYLDVTESGTTEATIYIDRYSGLPEVNDVHFYLKDELGNPVPDQMLGLNYKMGKDHVYLTVVSDKDGMVSFRAPPVEITLSTLSSSSTYPSRWALPVKNWYVPESGGQMDDVIVYSTTSMEEIWGFVKEKETGEPVQNAFTASQSFKLLEDVDDDFDPFGYIPKMPETAVPLSWVGSGSVADGYYRFWGRDTTFVYCSSDGYFPIIDRIELGTRADHRHDFMLEKIPEFDVFINGTLVNEEDEPIEGWIDVQDLDHDLYWVGSADTGPDGKFSITAYPGRFRVSFGNGTIGDRIEIEVTGDGLEGLILKLIPKSKVSGTVTNWNGTILEGINVTIQRIGDEEHHLVDWQWTDETGGFYFRVPGGEYRLVIEGTEHYEEYLGEPFTMDGWNNIQVNIIMENRTHGMLEGFVRGEGGQFLEGIPEAYVILGNSSGDLFEAFTNENGFFSFESVPYGIDYQLNATPPEWLVFMDGARPGYLSNSTYNITVNDPIVVSDVFLPYREFDEVEWLDVAEVSPEGEEVPLEAPIVMVFSAPVNRTLLQEGLIMVPPVGGLEFNYHQEGSIVIVNHDPFTPNTTYHLTIEGGVLSEDGAPMREFVPYSWQFTTGSEGETALIFDLIVEVTEVKDVHFSVIGKTDLTLFIVIHDVGPFEIPSVGSGIYETLVAGSNFEWNTTYSYYLSDSEGGGDIAPEFSGEFTTPEEPEEPPGWELYTAMIKVDLLMNWNITATGAPDQIVYLVIADVGSLLLDETESGIYKGTFEGSQFIWSEAYSYYFSDEESGTDLAPTLSGSKIMPEEIIVDDDDVDDDTDDDDDGVRDFFRMSGLIAAFCCGIVIILIIIVVLLFILGRGKRKKGKEWEE